MMLVMVPFDIMIVGAGPVGLYAAFYAGLRQMSVVIVDSLPAPGGQLTALYPEKYIYDVAGFPRVLAKDLAGNLLDQAMQYKPRLCLAEQVQTLQAVGAPESGGHFRVATDVTEHQARSVLIAAGVGSFQPRTLDLPEAPRLLGRGLHYFVSDVAALTGKAILIVGGGDSAVDWANMLSPIARSVTLIHRSDRFRAHEDSVARMRAGSTNVLTFHELAALEGEKHVERATIYDNRSKASQTLVVDAVLVNIGFLNSLGPIAEWGLELDGGRIVVDQAMRTSRAGVFAAGDVCSYPGKLKLIATGFGEAAIAVNHARTYLDPAASLFPGHSSNLKR